MPPRETGGLPDPPTTPKPALIKQVDYAGYLYDGPGADFAKCPYSVLMMCGNCTSYSKMSVLTHRRSETPVNGNPTSTKARQAISFANASNEALWRIICTPVHPHHRYPRRLPRKPTRLLRHVSPCIQNQGHAFLSLQTLQHTTPRRDHRRQQHDVMATQRLGSVSSHVLNFLSVPTFSRQQDTQTPKRRQREQRGQGSPHSLSQRWPSI